MSTQPNKKNNDWIWLPAMIICFATGLWPIALVILFWKIVNGGGKKTHKSTKAAQTAEDLSKAADDLSKAATDFVNTVTGKSATGKSKFDTAKTDKGKKVRGGTGLVIAGSIVAGIFGISTMACVATFMESLFMGYYFADELVGALFCLACLVAGLVMLCVGIGKNRRRDRWVSYLGYIGANRQVDLAHMAAAFDVPVRRLCDDLRKMLAEKILPNGWLDLAAGKLILSEMGYQAPPRARFNMSEGQQKKTESEKTEESQDDNAILAEIRAVNDAIPDPVMSEKIDRIGEITSKILDYQRRNPGKDSQLRSFLNYYLPTTLKILRSYAQLDAQGVEGENITAAKKRIEGMMDKVVEGFETQLDKLFADSAMDISSDVAVLEQMLEKDGLSGQNQGLTI